MYRRFIILFFVAHVQAQHLQFFIQSSDSNVIRRKAEILHFLYNRSFIDHEVMLEWNRISQLYVLTTKEFESLVCVNVEIRTAIQRFQRSAGLKQTGVIDNTRLKRETNDLKETQLDSFTTVHPMLPNISNLTWTYVNHTEYPNRYVVRNVVNKALREWKRAFDYTLGPSGMNFVETASSTGDVKISFHSRNHSDGYNFDGRGNILAHAFYPGTSKSGEIHLDLDEEWDENLLFSVLLHELGHTFGLGHSGVNTSIMFSWYFEDKHLLDEDDINGIFSKYHNKSIKVFGPRLTSHYPTSTSTTSLPSIPTPRPTKRINRPIIIHNRGNRTNGWDTVIYIYNSTIYMKN